MKFKLIPFLFFSVNLFGQISFEKNYGDTLHQWAYAVKQCYDNGYIATGYSFSNQFNTYLIRTDSLGDTLWTRKYEDMNTVGFDVIQTSDSNFVYSGYYNPSGYGFLRKVDQNGNTIWTKIAPGSGSWYQAVQETFDGGFICGGAVLRKMDAAGNTVWTKSAAGQIMYLIQDSDNNYVTLGFGGNILYLRKVDTAGTTIWTKSYPGDLQNTSNNCLAQTLDGGYIIVSVSPGGNEAQLLKTNINGDTLWTRLITEAKYGTSVIQTSDGGFAIGGITTDSLMIWIKTDLQGYPVCSLTFGNPEWEGAKSIQQTSDGGFILAGGITDTINNSEDFMLVKIPNQPGCYVPGLSIEPDESLDITAYPNPFSYQTQLQLDKYYTHLSIEVINMYGQVVKQMTDISGEVITIEQDNLAPGLYMLRVMDGGRELGVVKLVLNY